MQAKDRAGPFESRKHRTQKWICTFGINPMRRDPYMPMSMAATARSMDR